MLEKYKDTVWKYFVEEIIPVIKKYQVVKEKEHCVPDKGMPFEEFVRLLLLAIENEELSVVSFCL